MKSGRVAWWGRNRRMEGRRHRRRRRARRVGKRLLSKG